VPVRGFPDRLRQHLATGQGPCGPPLPVLRLGEHDSPPRSQSCIGDLHEDRAGGEESVRLHSSRPQQVFRSLEQGPMWSAFDKKAVPMPQGELQPLRFGRIDEVSIRRAGNIQLPPLRFPPASSARARRKRKPASAGRPDSSNRTRAAFGFPDSTECFALAEDRLPPQARIRPALSHQAEAPNRLLGLAGPEPRRGAELEGVVFTRKPRTRPGAVKASSAAWYRFSARSVAPVSGLRWPLPRVWGSSAPDAPVNQLPGEAPRVSPPDRRKAASGGAMLRMIAWPGGTWDSRFAGTSGIHCSTRGPDNRSEGGGIIVPQDTDEFVVEVIILRETWGETLF